MNLASWPDFEAQRFLCFISSPSLIVCCARLSTIGYRAFLVATARVEQFAAACHICSITVCLPQPPENTSLLALLFLTVPAIVNVVPDK